MAAGAQRYYISETNPNDSIGGGGCLCSEGRCEDRGGPYAVFHTTETDSNLSPHVVLCAPCARAVTRDVDSDAEQIKAGEPATTIDADSELIETLPAAHVNPVAEDDWPVITRGDDEDVVI